MDYDERPGCLGYLALWFAVDFGFVLVGMLIWQFICYIAELDGDLFSVGMLAVSLISFIASIIIVIRWAKSENKKYVSKVNDRIRAEKAVASMSDEDVLKMAAIMQAEAEEQQRIDEMNRLRYLVADELERRIKENKQPPSQ